MFSEFLADVSLFLANFMPEFFDKIKAGDFTVKHSKDKQNKVLAEE